MGTRPATPLIVGFIDQYRQVYGVESICRALSEHGVQIAPRTYRKARRRPGRSVTLLTRGSRTFAGSAMHPPKRCMTHYLRRQGLDVAFCTVDRLMRNWTSTVWLEAADTGGRFPPRTVCVLVTSSTGNSPLPRTWCGLPISRMYRPGPDGRMWRSCSMRFHARSSVGPRRVRRRPRWSPRRSTWPCGGATIMVIQSSQA